MRFIIECDDPARIEDGVTAIKSSIREGHDQCGYRFTDNSQWFVKKTKTGFSARCTNETPAQPKAEGE